MVRSINNKGRLVTPEMREKRRREVLDFMITVGPFSVPVKALSEKHDVTTDQVHDDIKYWTLRIPMDDMAEMGRKVLLVLKRNMAITEELKATGSVKDRLQAVSVSNQTAEIVTKMLESYGFKEKMADKVENTIKGEIAPISMMKLIEKGMEEAPKPIEKK